MADRRDWVLRIAFVRNFIETFHKDEMDMIKETGVARRQAYFNLNFKQLCGKFTILTLPKKQSLRM